MPISTRSCLAAGSAVLAGLALACSTHKPSPDDDVRALIAVSSEANAALMRGDALRYGALIRQADDFTLMSPFGGKPTRGAATAERMAQIGKFFRNGSFQQELVHAYSSEDMVVLALIERAHVEAGGLPAQDWALRVTLVYRRENGQWRLAHRHADPLANGIALEQAAALARGSHAAGG